MVEFEVTPMIKKIVLDTYAPKVYHIKSDTDSNKEYNVTLARNHIECTCRDYLYRSRDKEGYKKAHNCKHIKKLCKQLLKDKY